MIHKEIQWTGQEWDQLDSLREIKDLVVFASSDQECLASFFRFLTLLERSGATIVMSDEMEDVAEATGFTNLLR